MLDDIKGQIEQSWNKFDKAERKPVGGIMPIVLKALEALDRGEIRAAEQIDGEWQVNEWVKKLILLYFHHTPGQLMPTGYEDGFSGEMMAFDKIPLKTAGWSGADFERAGFRMVPGTVLRKGAYIAPSVVLMPSFINIGAYVGPGTMIDTWATVGSCAQVGANCHISGGAGIGGVLEPLNARPVIIEDDVFIGARSEVAEGVIVGRGSVLSMGVFIGASTPVIDRKTGEIHYGRVPPYSVVLPGTRTVDGHEGANLNMPCAIIAKTVDERTKGKVALNEIVRD